MASEKHGSEGTHEKKVKGKPVLGTTKKDRPRKRGKKRRELYERKGEPVKKNVRWHTHKK